MLRVPLTVEAVPKFTPPAMSTSLKAIVPETVPLPAKLNFEVPAVKVPLFVNDPLFAIVIVGVPDVLKVAPELMVNEFKLTELAELFIEFEDDAQKLESALHQKAASFLNEGNVHDAWLTLLSFNN
jgi:hypothetical protein